MDAEFFQAADEGCAHVGSLDGEGIGFVFVFAGGDAKEDREQERNWRVEEDEKGQAGVDGDVFRAEGSEKLFVLKKERENEEHQSALQDGGSHHLENVFEFEVSHLVCEHDDDLVVVEFFHQRVEEDDPSEFAEASEEGVQACGTF